MFGCDAFAHVPKDEFDSKARKRILVGYGKETKAYRLYDTYSRDVQFNEETKESSLGSPADDYRIPK